jgi:hypothetical protein
MRLLRTVAAACAALLFPFGAWSAPQSFVFLTPDPGEFITQGNSFFYTSDTGSFTVFFGASPTFVHLRFDTSDATHFWDAAFLTQAPLEAGTTYTVPLNFPLANFNAPNMNVTGDFKGYSPLSGTFTIYDISFAGGELQSFAIGFHELGTDSTAALNGFIWLNSAADVPVALPSAVAVPEPAPLLLTTAGLLILFGIVRRQRAASSRARAS